MKTKNGFVSITLLGMMVFTLGLGIIQPVKAQGVTLKIIVTDQQAPGVEAVIDEFLADTLGTGVDAVEVISSGTRADDQLVYLTTQMAAGSSEFDVVGLDTVWTAQFAENGWIDELTLESGEFDDYFSGMVDSSMYNGKAYAYPYFLNLGVLFYRADILARNGYDSVDDFDTWDEFKAAANTILANATEQALDPDLVGFVGQFDAYEGGVCNFIEWMGSAGQTSIFDSDGEVDLNNTDVQSAMTFLNGLIAPRYTGVQGTDYIVPREGLTHDEGSSVGKWTAGEAIFMRQWPFAYGNSKAEAGLNATDGSGNYVQFGVTAMPTKTGGDSEKSAVVGGAVLAIPTSGTQKTEAMNLIRFLGDEVAQLAELTECSNFPALKSAFDNLPAGYEWVAEFESAAERTLARPVHPKYATFSVEIADYFNDILGGVKSVNEGLGKMESAITEIISGKIEIPGNGIPGYSIGFLVVALSLTVSIILVRKRRT
ncbi:extracellular solute-binding protein [Candidatus Lokiarchaeum ossiferum]